MTEPQGRLVLIRHGQTEWSASGKHTGMTDIPLTEQGEAEARALASLLTGYDFGAVLSSPLVRARRTAELAGLTAEIDDDLREWDYGGYEGRTTKEIRAELGHDWTVFADGVVPGATPGELLEEVAARAARVLAKVAPVLAERDVALVGHGHTSRILAATYLQQQPRFAGQLLLDSGTIGVLEVEREVPAIRLWNHRADR
ncbi:histidine phosphatase family protein [Janibacter sp. G1551]|uniref:histidine phosphatase family protein n=1 Tax=Janibacter sp. G1551 TaxID=3420440 RepID=UPI003D01ACE7